MELTSDNVEAVFMDCLFDDATELVDGRPLGDFVMAPGITHGVGFHPGRLDGHRADVESMLSQLPSEFLESTGKGWSFLNACNRADDVQWTGLHLRMEQLFQLGQGLGLVDCPLEREFWTVLPGGMPYYVVRDDLFQE